MNRHHLKWFAALGCRTRHLERITKRKAQATLRALSLCLALFLSAFTTGVQAEVKLHSLFSDNMVLQRDKPVPVWGTASPNEKVTVSIGTRSKSTQADANGKWLVTLDPMPVARAQTLTVKASNEITLTNVAIGDVYLCSGQSNMAYGMDGFAPSETPLANHPDIRLFTVPLKITTTPQHDLAAPAAWKVCSPQTVQQFSATAYFVGRDLNQRLDVPIGLLVSAWGGTAITSWLSRDTLLKHDETRATTLDTETSFIELSKGSLADQMKRWWAANDPGTKNNWGSPTFDDSAWKTVKVPGPWQKNEIGNFKGVVWFRRQIDVPAAWAGKDAVLNLAQIGNQDTTYFNGEEVGDRRLSLWYELRSDKIPAHLLNTGRATIAVGILNINDSLDQAGFLGRGPMDLKLAGSPTQKIDISGDWKYEMGPALKDLPVPPKFTLGSLTNPSQPEVLYNGMIAPLQPFAVRGVIWYQGEADAGNPVPYRILFPELIRSWRAAWKAKQDGSEFGFYFVQLPNFIAPPGEDWAQLREAQALALQLPRTGMATTIDIGNPNNIHPGHKDEVGRRLSLAALAIEYGQKIEYASPTFAGMKIEGNNARIDFSHAAGLKTTDAKALEGFTIQGQDGKWYPAIAHIEGEEVVVSSDLAPNPKAVRYAWANNPTVNLVNAAGLPATPFRTDGPPAKN